MERFPVYKCLAAPENVPSFIIHSNNNLKLSAKKTSLNTSF